ncbi:MAG: sugar transferase [Myxococcales bacterium]|nr:sugar transferase [Myxococcales bacterium]
MTGETGSRRRALAGKRALDLVLLGPTVPLFAAATGALALVVLALDGRPVLFSQDRVGQGGRAFRIWKLRTMTREADPRDRRPTRLGRWLRGRGLDELPQLFNVLRGDMSLVGPRPLTHDDLERLTRAHAPFAQRQEVPPGLTGLAQVCRARGPALTAALDSAYARERDIVMDLRILVRTLWMNLVGKDRGAMPSAAVVTARAERSGAAAR